MYGALLALMLGANWVELPKRQVWVEFTRRAVPPPSVQYYQPTVVDGLRGCFT